MLETKLITKHMKKSRRKKKCNKKAEIRPGNKKKVNLFGVCLLMRFLVLLQEFNINLISIIKQASIIIYVLKTNEKHPIAFITITSNCVLKITIK